MIKRILTLSALCFALTAQAQKFVLKGKIEGQHPGLISISYLNSQKEYVQDSAVVTNGRFELSGNIMEPVMAYLSGDVQTRSVDDPNAASLFLEPGQLQLELRVGDFKNFRLKGSRTQEEFETLNKLKAPIVQDMKPIYADLQKANDAYNEAKKSGKADAEVDMLREKAAAVRDKLQPFNVRQNRIDMDFIKGHPDSYLSAYLLRWKISALPLAEAKKLFEGLGDKIRQSVYGRDTQQEIDKLQGGSPGSTASVFSANDINGEPLSLAEFRGKKYVLLDFWASWCVPCRKGNPHLLSVYSKYRDKGFEIIGVSDDDSNPDAWKKAVAQDQIGVWRHVLRGLKRTSTGYDKSGDISEPYGIHSLPTKILIDKNGLIIGRYGGGGEGDEALDKKLSEVFRD